ncbi:MAG: transposase [Pseudonocardiaceae bacterium]
MKDQIRPLPISLSNWPPFPGVGQATAEIIIAETGRHMSRFRTAEHLVS